MKTGDDLRRTAVVIEDDADIRMLLETTLTQAGFAVHTAGTGQDGVQAVREHDPVVTTLDISLPDIDGFTVAQRVREFSTTYILMLTGRDDEVDTLLGLAAGADDYVTKPFRPREVRARIDAMLRRPRQVRTPGPLGEAVAPSVPGEQARGTSSGTGAAETPVETLVERSAETPAAAPEAPEEGVRQFGGLVVDTCARLVVLDGTNVDLTRSEFDILAALVDEPRRVASKAGLAELLWPDAYGTGRTVLDADRRALEVHVANLRRKLGEDAGNPRFIQTVRGVGYRLAPGPR